MYQHKQVLSNVLYNIAPSFVYSIRTFRDFHFSYMHELIFKIYVLYTMHTVLDSNWSYMDVSDIWYYDR